MNLQIALEMRELVQLKWEYIQVQSQPLTIIHYDISENQKQFTYQKIKHTIYVAFQNYLVNMTLTLMTILPTNMSKDLCVCEYIYIYIKTHNSNF